MSRGASTIKAPGRPPRKVEAADTAARPGIKAYRALEHGRARTACEHKQAMGAFPPEVRGFADTFVVLQKVRQQADYAFDVRFGKPDVLAAIDSAEAVIARFEQADAQHRRAFVAHVLFKRRPS